MARVVFKLPDVGEGTTEAEIVKWYVELGGTVQEGEPLVDIMTDKATVEVAAPVSGRIAARHGDVGTRAAVGSELVVFETASNESEPVVKSRAPSSAPEKPFSAAPASVQQITGKILASPAVRDRAKKLNFDLSQVVGSGPDGRIQHADLDALLLSKQGPDSFPAAPAIAAAEEGVEDINIFGLRRRIAERMQDAKRRIPHFTYVEEVDVTDLEALRAELNAARAAKGHLTILAFLMRALVKAVTEHPGLNAHFNDTEGVIRRFSRVHAGIATQTERGLLVPVIHHAETMNLWELAAEILRLSQAARSGKAVRDDLIGSTITVTSLGALGGIAATPIINPPEVAIIGLNRIAERPVVIEGAIAIRKMMNLSSSFDHRIIDGFAAAAFVKTIKTYLEIPVKLIT